MNNKISINKWLIATIIVILASCGKETPAVGVIRLIDATENQLHNSKSLDELQETHFALLDKIKDYLDLEQNTYRFTEGDAEYNKVMNRFERYNIVFCRVLSKFNPEMNSYNGDKEKIVLVLALMKKMENSALTKSEGFALQNDQQRRAESDNQSVFPTKEEIESVNAELPVLVAEGTLNTKVEYDDRTKVQTFYYRFTQEVDENLITEVIIQQMKTNMVCAIKKDENNMKRLNAGMVYLYIYYSIDNRKLYEITIDSNDVK